MPYAVQQEYQTTPCRAPSSDTIRQHPTPATGRDWRCTKHNHKWRPTCRYTQHTHGTRNSEVCPRPLRAEWAPQGNKEENKSDNICLLTFNAVLVRKRFCHFLDFGLYFFSIFDAVQCFSVSGCSFSYMFRQFLTCVWIFLLSLRRSLHCFLWRQECAHLRRGCFHLRGLVSSCAAMHAAFQRLLQASALVS